MYVNERYSINKVKNMFLKYTWLFFLLVAMCVLFACRYQNNVAWNAVTEGFNVIDIIYSGLTGNSFLTKNVSSKEKVFTTDELKLYTNLEDGLYIAILGQVYDVTDGAQHYAPGETYHVFTGRDASSAFITGKFDDEGLTDDVFALSTEQIKSLHQWAQFYNKKYIYKGKLAGTYYELDGRPAIAYYKLQERLKLAEEKKLKEQKLFPPCNIEWQADIGTRVWCTNRSGGIERAWVGVPRMLFESPDSEQYRCACINQNSEEYEESKANLREYKGCHSSASNCIINTNK